MQLYPQRSDTRDLIVGTAPQIRGSRLGSAVSLTCKGCHRDIGSITERPAREVIVEHLVGEHGWDPADPRLDEVR